MVGCFSPSICNLFYLGSSFLGLVVIVLSTAASASSSTINTFVLSSPPFISKTSSSTLAFAIPHRRRPTAAMSTELKYKSMDDVDFPGGRSFRDNMNVASGVHDNSNLSNNYDNDWEESKIRRLSALSNTIFLSAGIMYLTTSSWDIHPPTPEDDTSKALMIYNLIENLAPVTYLVNSLLDIHLANRIKQAQKVKRRRKRLILNSGSSDNDSTSASANLRDEEFLESWEDDDSSHGTQKVSNQNQNHNSNSSNSGSHKSLTLHRVRKYAAHRREITAAFTFFVAALFSVLPVVIPLTLGIIDDDAFTIFDGVSIHTYLLSSIFALMGSIRAVPHLDWNFGKADTLETLGDLLFFGGSMVDMILYDFHFDDGIVSWPIFSSTLWCIDALLYLNSDWVAAKMLRVKDEVIV